MYILDLQILLAVALDLVLGDPRWFPHPVRVIGFFCGAFEKLFRRLWNSEYLAGLCTVCSVLLTSVGAVVALLILINRLSPPASIIFAVFLLYTMVAVRDLLAHSREVYNKLRDGDLAAARVAVSMIVGRDTSGLDREGVARAAVETVSENMVDGITAPLFYAVLAGILAPVAQFDPLFAAVTGAVAYKTINTMDSMFGYKNERYLYFGNSAALLDDFVNWLPARISGLVLVPAAALCGCNWQGAWKIFTRDRLAHASPNAAHSEAATAGALGVELGGVSSYFGKNVVKPVIGEKTREIEPKDILDANRLVVTGSAIFLLLMLTARHLMLIVL